MGNFQTTHVTSRYLLNDFIESQHLKGATAGMNDVRKHFNLKFSFARVFNDSSKELVVELAMAATASVKRLMKIL